MKRWFLRMLEFLHLKKKCHFCPEVLKHHHLWGAIVGGQKTVLDEPEPALPPEA
jgi:hypothetical protein